jgi:Zn-dependent protease/CBS domain-containing protein
MATTTRTIDERRPELDEHPAGPHRPHPHGGNAYPVPGFRFGRVSGIELYVDWSLAIIFALVAFGLGAGALPRWHPDWNPLLRWVVAFTAALAFFTSILLHELSHALVGRVYGVKVPRITLFVFGGMAHMQGEPSTPKAELLMAAAGPLVSFIIGSVATFVGVHLAGAVDATTPEQVVETAGPIATILLWLGPINVILAIFNLVPGFPLDGGRVFRALLWWGTGDLDRATRWASRAGQAVGWTLIILGVLMAFGFRVPFFGTGLGGGLWIALIGWFLNNAARMSYAQMRMRRRLSHVPVRTMMRASLDTVTPGTTIAELVRDHIMKTDQTTFPVLDETGLAGMVSTRDVQRIPSDEWSFVTVRQVMTAAEDVPSIDADADASEALERLATGELEQLPVTEHGRLSGFVRRQDILKWLSLQPDLAR